MHNDEFCTKKQKPIFTKRFQIPLSGLPYDCPSVPLRAIGIHFPSEERSDIFGCTRNQRFRFGRKSINFHNIKSSGCLFELIAKKCQHLYVNQCNGMIRVRWLVEDPLMTCKLLTFNLTVWQWLYPFHPSFSALIQLSVLLLSDGDTSAGRVRGFAWPEQLCTERTFVIMPTPPFSKISMFSLRNTFCQVMLWLCNISKIPTLERYLCTSCSDRRHEGALLRLHPVLSNQNMHSSPGTILFTICIYLFLRYAMSPVFSDKTSIHEKGNPIFVVSGNQK